MFAKDSASPARWISGLAFFILLERFLEGRFACAAGLVAHQYRNSHGASLRRVFSGGIYPASADGRGFRRIPAFREAS